MASRILLISTNRCDFPYPVFPLGVAYLDAALRRAGHDCRWLDCQCDPEPLEAVIREFQPEFIAFSLRNIDDVVFKRRETYYGALPSLCRTARAQTAAPLILGGSGFSIFPEALLELSGADYGIVGEGEAALVALVAALESHRDPAAIPGLVRRGHAPAGSRATTPLAADALAVPPARPPRLVDYYLRTSSMLNVQTQRGCAHECCYCTYPLLEGHRVRRSAPEAVADEFAAIERLGARYVFVVDSVFNSSPAHVLGVCEAIIRRGVKLPWAAFLRPQGLDREQMQAMARAGLTHIEFGSDSLSDRVLEAYGKRFSFADIRQSNELARAAGIDACHYLLCGGPGETTETLRETFERSALLDNAVILALPGMRIYPGTPLHRLAIAAEPMPAADLLEPRFFFSPDLGGAAVQSELERFAQTAPNWIVSEPNAAYHDMAARLRQRGVVGPLWSYLALLRRILPTPRAVSPS